MDATQLELALSFPFPRLRTRGMAHVKNDHLVAIHGMENEKRVAHERDHADASLVGVVTDEWEFPKQRGQSFDTFDNGRGGGPKLILRSSSSTFRLGPLWPRRIVSPTPSGAEPSTGRPLRKVPLDDFRSRSVARPGVRSTRA